jgi:hypothetical protein
MMQNIQQQEQTPETPATGFDPNQPWSGDNRPRTWAEMQQAYSGMAAKQAQDAVAKYQQDQLEQSQKQQQEQFAAAQAVDGAFTRLRLSGVLPPVQDANNPQDAGKLAETELLGYTLAMGGQTAEDMVYASQALMQQHALGKYYDAEKKELVTRPGYQPAAFAPIAGGTPMMGAMALPTGPTQSQLGMGRGNLESLFQIGMQNTQ